MARTQRVVQRSFDELARPGPHRVLRGDLALVGMPGVIFTPESGWGLPAIAFGHGWLQPTSRYEELLRHLASWGVIAAAPATQRGALPSPAQFAADLRSALDLCVGVRLGDGRLSVDPWQLGLVAHGMGASCAVLAASVDKRVAAVATLALAQTLPTAVDAARGAIMPGLHLAGGQDRVAPPIGHAEPVAKAWAGPAQLRILPKASHLGFLYGKHWSDLMLDSHPEHGTRRVARALVTAFLLRNLTRQAETDITEYDDVLTRDAPGAPLTFLR